MSLLTTLYNAVSQVFEFDTPANLLGNTIQITAVGGNAHSGYGAFITAVVPTTVLPIKCIVAGPGTPLGPGGNGLSGGGGGGVNTDGGGGSSGVVTGIGGLTPTILIEAGGADAGYETTNPSNPSAGPTGTGGTGGGFVSSDALLPNPFDSTFYSPGGAGGAAGGHGGSGAVNIGDVFPGYAGGVPLYPGGLASAINGGTSLCISSFTAYQPGLGVGSGGLPVLNKGACYASGQVVSYTYGNGDSSLSPPQVSVSYRVADAPNHPIVQNWNGSPNYVDSMNSSWTVTAQYAAPSPDTGSLEAVQYAFTSTAFSGTMYWDGTGLNSSPQWVSPQSGLGTGNGGFFSTTFPAGLFPDGVGQQFTFTVAARESNANLDSTTSNPRTVLCVRPPTVTITSPAPNATVTTLTPTVNWSINVPQGTPTNRQIFVYLGPPPEGGGNPFTTIYYLNEIHSPTSIGGGNYTDTYTFPSHIFNSINTYYVYISVTTNEGITSQLVFVPFTVTLTLAGYTVALAGEPWFDPSNSMPAPYLELVATGTGSTIFAEFEADYMGGTNFIDIYNGDAVRVSSNTALFYDDFCPFNQALAYRGRVLTTIGTGVNGPQTYASAWSNTVTMEVASQNWWVVPPSQPTLSMELHRLPSTSGGTSTSTLSSPATPTMPGGMDASIMIDEEEQLGTFRPFGKSTAVSVHGDIWAAEFDLNLYFYNPDEWANFRTIRQLKAAVLLKSDMEGQIYWMTFGADLNPGIPSETGRQVNPTRAVTIYCTPSDPPALP